MVVDGSKLNVTSGVQKISGPWQFAQIGASTAGDVDGDGVSDILLGDPGPAVNNRSGTVYLLAGADLAALDRADGTPDHWLYLGNVAGDTDGDGVRNTVDRDDDGDDIPDGVDAFQLDPQEWADTDHDTVGDNADAFPNDYGERFDTDGDGLGDRFADDDDDGDGIVDDKDIYPRDTDNDGTENRDDEDDDGDGVPDIDDALPIDPAESEDTDGDGIGNHADTDDDSDGVSDDEDVFPLDPAESVDTDADGVGDNADAFPSDPNEAGDHDGDGIGDNADTDDDNDGILDAEDGFPLDDGASTDTDGDGVPDSRDAFPDDAGESEDTDGDGTGDNSDGVKDTSDLFPRDGSRWDPMSFRVGLGLTGQGTFTRVAIAGDLDGDHRPEMLIPGLGAEGDSSVLIVSPADLAGADSADGVPDGSAQLRHVLAGMHSWKLMGEEGYSTGTILSPLGDLNEDGIAEFFVGASARSSAGYIISGADLLAADAADTVVDGVIDLAHIASQPGSWKLLGYWGGGTVLTSVPADLDGDGSVEFAIGQPGSRSGDSPGTVHVISADILPMLDASMNGEVRLAQSEGHELWRFVGEAPGDDAGFSLTITDFNADGHLDLVVAAPGNDTTQVNQGAVYLLDSKDLASADLADGSADRQVQQLARIKDESGSWKLVGDVAQSGLGIKIAAGDLDGDGRQDLVLSSWNSESRRLDSLLTGLPESLPAMDRADGAADSVIDLTGNESPHLVQVTGSPTWTPSQVGLTDFDGDGRDDIVVAVDRRRNIMVAYLIAASTLFADNNEATGGVVEADDVFARGSSYQLFAPEAQSVDAHVALAAAGDVDADGLGDILVAVLPHRLTVQPTHAGVPYLIVAADLPHLYAVDGKVDGRIFLQNLGRGRGESLGGAQNMMESSATASGGGCFVGLLVRPGERCTYPGTDDAFTDNERGRGYFLTFLAGIRIRVNNQTINGRVYDFVASHQGDGVWRIDRVAGSTEPPTADDSDGDGIPNDSDPDDGYC